MNQIDLHQKSQLPVVTGEYLYYKGIIRGLQEAVNSREFNNA